MVQIVGERGVLSLVNRRSSIRSRQHGTGLLKGEFFSVRATPHTTLAEGIQS
jgi:hypothetical protein